MNPLGRIAVLGRGLNPLSRVSGQVTGNRVVDTTSNPWHRTFDGVDYELGQSVSFESKRDFAVHIYTFESSADYFSKSSLKANLSGSYGAFSMGFEGTFDQEITVLNGNYGAIYNCTEKLWSVKIDVDARYLSPSLIEAVNGLPEWQDDYSKVGADVEFFQTFGLDVVAEVTTGAA